MTDQPGFDPRYNPAYQRGYQHSAERRLVTPIRPAAARAASGEDSPGSSATEAEPPAHDGPPPHATSAPDVAIMEDSAAGDDSSGWVLRGNPYIVAMWLVGGALIALGLLGQWHWAAAFNPAFGGSAATSPEGYFLAQIAGAMAPLCTALGFGALVVLLVLHAIRWRPGRNDDR